MPGLSQRVIFSLFSSSMLPPRSPRRCKRASTPCNTVPFQTYHRSKPRNVPLPTAVPKPGKSPALRGFVAGAPGLTTAVLYPSTKIERPKPGRNRPQRGVFSAGRGLARSPPETGTQGPHGADGALTAGPGRGPGEAAVPPPDTGPGNPPAPCRPALGSRRPSSPAAQPAPTPSMDTGRRTHCRPRTPG